MISTEIFNFTDITNALNKVFAYLPQLITSITILLAGVFITDQVKSKLSSLQGAFGNNSIFKIISNVVIMEMMFFFILMSLGQAGVDNRQH